MAVLFADVAGSTKLYDTLGDTQAKQMIDECIETMRGITTRYGGRVIKTIGDEVMCVLPDADSGCLAATDMQTRITDLPGVGNVKRAIRVGFHAGPVIEQDNDVFGDTVNVAARMAGVARAQQIITTRATVDMLSPLLRKSSRKIAALSVKGKGDDVEVCEIIWQGEEELTTMATTIAPVGTGQSVLRLQYGASLLVLDKPNVSIVLGRDVGCNVPISDRMASRHHARIERRRDKFYLVDQSTNGTYVLFAGETEIALRREEVMLRGVGRIAFGRSVAQSEEDTVEFVLTA
ncbi:adenylate/guanylate cyclase domain-containing protein [Betaproteobacteria bacterium GR16-43]|nr:adenylate/guanylate cyclase domain-containing protein [Betaproteobacteria bacterium GR16-43]